MNFIWTVLNKGEASDMSIPYARKTDRELKDIPFNPELTVSSLVPATPVEARYFRIERLIQMVYDSPFRKRMLELDPHNTYGFSVDVPPDVSVINPTTLNAVPMPTASKEKPVVIYDILLNVPEEKITVSSEYGNSELLLNMNNNLSDVIALSDTMSVRFQGDITAQVNGSEIKISDTRHPIFDIPKLIEAVNVPEWYDADMRRAFEMGSSVEKLSAAVINTAIGVQNG